MKVPTLLITVFLVAVIGLVMAPSPAMAQSPDGSSVKRVEPVKDGRGAIDFAAARADADAKARQSTDVDVKNKLNQKQSAVGIGIGGSSSADVKNKISNVNNNTLKTGDTTNFNINGNKQIQSFGLPLGRELPVR